MSSPNQPNYPGLSRNLHRGNNASMMEYGTEMSSTLDMNYENTASSRSPLPRQYFRYSLPVIPTPATSFSPSFLPSPFVPHYPLTQPHFFYYQAPYHHDPMLQVQARFSMPATTTSTSPGTDTMMNVRQQQQQQQQSADNKWYPPSSTLLQQYPPPLSYYPTYAPMTSSRPSMTPEQFHPSYPVQMTSNYPSQCYSSDPYGSNVVYSQNSSALHLPEVMHNRSKVNEGIFHPMSSSTPKPSQETLQQFAYERDRMMSDDRLMREDGGMRDVREEALQDSVKTENDFDVDVVGGTGTSNPNSSMEIEPDQKKHHRKGKRRTGSDSASPKRSRKDWNELNPLLQQDFSSDSITNTNITPGGMKNSENMAAHKQHQLGENFYKAELSSATTIVLRRSPQHNTSWETVIPPSKRLIGGLEPGGKSTRISPENPSRSNKPLILKHKLYPIADKPKGKRGRPRKYPLMETKFAVTAGVGTSLDQDKVVRVITKQVQRELQDDHSMKLQLQMLEGHSTQQLHGEMQHDLSTNQIPQEILDTLPANPIPREMQIVLSTEQGQPMMQDDIPAKQIQMRDLDDLSSKLGQTKEPDEFSMNRGQLKTQDDLATDQVQLELQKVLSAPVINKIETEAIQTCSIVTLTGDDEAQCSVTMGKPRQANTETTTESEIEPGNVILEAKLCATQSLENERANEEINEQTEEIVNRNKNIEIPESMDENVITDKVDEQQLEVVDVHNIATDSGVTNEMNNSHVKKSDSVELESSSEVMKIPPVFEALELEPVARTTAVEKEILDSTENNLSKDDSGDMSNPTTPTKGRRKKPENTDNKRNIVFSASSSERALLHIPEKTLRLRVRGSIDPVLNRKFKLKGPLFPKVPITYAEKKLEKVAISRMQTWLLNKEQGETYLHRAAKENDIDVTLYCLKFDGCHPRCTNNRGFTPLHEACKVGSEQVAKILLDHGAYHSQPARGNIRPIHIAAQVGNLELVQLLLDFGANPFLTTMGGTNCFDLAESHQEVMECLNEYFSLLSFDSPGSVAEIGKQLQSDEP